MPMAAPKPCGKVGCRKYAESKGRCADHQIKAWDHKKNRHERGYDAKWCKTREIVLQRDSFLCQNCRRNGIYTLAKQVDHIKPKCNGGTDDQSNLEAICCKCHTDKTSRESIEARLCQTL